MSEEAVGRLVRETMKAVSPAPQSAESGAKWTWHQWDDELGDNDSRPARALYLVGKHEDGEDDDHMVIGYVYPDAPEFDLIPDMAQRLNAPSEPQDDYIKALESVAETANRLREDEQWVPIAMTARYSGLVNALASLERTKKR